MNIAKVIKSSPAFVFPALINLLSLVAFTRLLSLEEYGRLSLALVSVELVQGILYTWINMCVMRFYNAQDRLLSIGAGFQLNALISAAVLLAAGSAYFMSGLLLPLDPVYVLLILLGVVGRGVANFVQECFRIYKTNLRAYTIITVLANASYYLPAIVYLFLSRNTSIHALLAIQVAGVFLFLLIVGWLYRHLVVEQLRIRRSKMLYLDFLKYGVPLIVSFVSLSILTRIDRYIIQYTVGAEPLGMYSAAFSLSNLAISSFFLVLTLPTYPEIMRRFNHGDESGAREIYKKNGQIILLVCIPLVILTFVLNTFLCSLFFGAEKGAKVALLFPWVVLATFFYNYKLHYFEQIFQFYKRTNISMYIGIVVGLAHLVISYYFSIIWGAEGVSYSGILLNGLAIGYIIYYRKYQLYPRGDNNRSDREYTEEHGKKGVVDLSSSS